MSADVCLYCKTPLNSDGTEHHPERCRDVLRLRVTALEVALERGIETAEEGWGYASKYFQEKWGSKEQIDEMRKAMKGET